jgi:hypothetical protein
MVEALIPRFKGAFLACQETSIAFLGAHSLFTLDLAGAADRGERSGLGHAHSRGLKTERLTIDHKRLKYGASCVDSVELDLLG